MRSHTRPCTQHTTHGISSQSILPHHHRLNYKLQFIRWLLSSLVPCIYSRRPQQQKILQHSLIQFFSFFTLAFFTFGFTYYYLFLRNISKRLLIFNFSTKCNASEFYFPRAPTRSYNETSLTKPEQNSNNNKKTMGANRF